MSSDKVFQISIPSDADGYVLLKCPNCSEKFMLQVGDVKDEATIDIWCPHCGLKYDNYLDDDIYDEAQKIIHNQFADVLNEFSKNMEATFRHSKNIKFKPGKKIEREYEMPIGRKTGDYEEKNYPCCDKTARIKTITKFEGGYCPFCGEIVDGD